MIFSVASVSSFLSTLSLRRATRTRITASRRQKFLSTLSLRRATLFLLSERRRQAYFYPRSPCGERLPRSLLAGFPDRISIHALLAESDTVSRIVVSVRYQFLSTLSLRRATYLNFKVHLPIMISIHALLAESDVTMAVFIHDTRKFLSTLSLRRATKADARPSSRCTHFYPRSPCGERRIPWTRSKCRQLISIHALLAESDQFFPPRRDRKHNFYPRSPCGERPRVFQLDKAVICISIHALLAESDPSF